MHVGHTSVVQKERATMVYAPVTNISFNVGKLIFSQIKLSINNSDLTLYFPMIITALCARAGVKFHEDSEWLQLMKAIGDAYWRKNIVKRRVDFLDAEPTESGSSSQLQALPPLPPQPR